MNRALVHVLAVLASFSLCQAGVVPATQPGSPSGVSPADKVIVLPIESPDGTYKWVGKAIQQDMLVDLTQMTRAQVAAPSGPPAADADAALRAARDAGAAYVVFGTVQNAGAQLRVIGQVLDVASGKSVANLKATAPADDLFPIEDALAMQVARALPQNLMRPNTTASSSPNTLPTVINEQPYVSAATPAPQYESVPTATPGYVYSPYVEPYPYVYPDYGYYGYGALGWWGPGVVIIGPHHFHDHVDHDFDHRSFVSPHVNPGLRHGGFGGHGSFGGFGGTRGNFGSAGGGFGGGMHSGSGMHGGGGMHSGGGGGARGR
jgi:TolB-like protein